VIFVYVVLMWCIKVAAAASTAHGRLSQAGVWSLGPSVCTPVVPQSALDSQHVHVLLNCLACYGLLSRALHRSLEGPVGMTHMI
jgi:hypothetical protein